MVDAPSRPVDCPHRVPCGACSLLGQPYPVQLQQKRRWLMEALDRHLPSDSHRTLPTVPSPRVDGYRNRAKMTVSTDRLGHSALGYFQRRSREVVDAPHCGVLVAELLDTTRRFRELLNSKQVGFPFALRHIDLRCGSDPTRQHLTLVIKADAPPPLPLNAIMDACPHVVGIGINLNPGPGPQVIKGPIEPAVGAREVFVESEGLALRVSAGSFFQVNLGLLPAIHARMAQHLARGGLLLDLYAGVGTHGLAFRAGFERVICVEGVRCAAADARSSMKTGRVDNVEVLASPIHRALRRLRSERPAAIILNPSAAGAEPRVLELCVSSTASSLAYLSCDPGTLARDLAVLVRGRFELVSVQAVDMMPQTRQVEALALLRR